MTNDYFLSSGKHVRPEDGRCAMEWVAYLAGEPHSDSPSCVSPVLKAFCIGFNDGLPDDRRQLLRPYLARTIGTAGDGLDEQRAWTATDWLIRVYTPAWLALAGLGDAAASLRVLPPVLAAENLTRAMADLNAAVDAARAAAGAAARAAARAAAGDAARAAAWDAAWAAARAAARAAAGDAARAAAWDAAWAAARAAARAAAGDAAWAAAGAAAGAAARAAAAAGDAAGDAARAALQTTVDVLQRSAFELLDRMLPTEIIQFPVAVDADAVCLVPA